MRTRVPSINQSTTFPRPLLSLLACFSIVINGPEPPFPLPPVECKKRVHIRCHLLHEIRDKSALQSGKNECFISGF